MSTTTVKKTAIIHTPSGSVVNNLKTKEDLLQFIDQKKLAKHESACIFYQNGSVYVRLERQKRDKLPYSLYEGTWYPQ